MDNKKIKLIKDTIGKIAEEDALLAIKNALAGDIIYIDEQVIDVHWEDYTDKYQAFRKYEKVIEKIISNKERCKKILDTDTKNVDGWLSVANENELVGFVEEIYLNEEDSFFTNEQLEKYGQLIFNMQGNLAKLTGNYKAKFDENGNCIEISS